MELSELDEARTVVARLADPRPGAGASVGARDGEAVRRVGGARRRDLRRGGGRGAGGGSGATMQRSACASTARGRCCPWAVHSAGTGSGPPRAGRWSKPRPRSTRSARPAGRSRRAPSLPGSAPAGRSRPGELTPTERQVAELAAEGLSNKEIAQALFVTRAHGRGAPLARLREARRPLAVAARRPSVSAGSAASKFEGFRDFAGARRSLASTAWPSSWSSSTSRGRTPPSSLRARGAGPPGGRRADPRGKPVSYVRSIFVPEDETCFFLYEAASADAVARRRAARPLSFERVAEAFGEGCRATTAGGSQ